LSRGHNVVVGSSQGRYWRVRMTQDNYWPRPSASFCTLFQDAKVQGELQEEGHLVL